MPHFTVEYSSNLDMAIDMTDLCDVIREVALETGIFPIGGLRVRAVRCDHYSIADDHPDNAFIDIAGKIGVGREEKVRQAAAIMMFKKSKPIWLHTLKRGLWRFPLKSESWMKELT